MVKGTFLGYSKKDITKNNPPYETAVKIFITLAPGII
jgi:hypothetical protein